MTNDVLTDMQGAIEELRGAVIPIFDLETNVRDIKKVLELMSTVLADLIQETSETPAAYTHDLTELSHLIRAI